ncbi:hypothetical protein IW261DRAFT_604052 [Armillaria novae-zelandiae]|uniref:XPG-I domain-containing protein n=1 Tax=Armillaria novae-zelandiae TaxID=153914 RepID=A0AA39PN61_9AGAR|nr:hypothetical protein IW261DRAFT_604052 [Armillaria novae-zelandiae]
MTYREHVFQAHGINTNDKLRISDGSTTRNGSYACERNTCEGHMASRLQISRCLPLRPTMGVAKLWPLLDEFSSRKSLYELTISSTNRPPHAFRLGVDVSLWFFHAEYGKEGENPELRTLFFRLGLLLRHPILPLFIFDGPGRPSWKRGKRINTWAEDPRTEGLKAFIEAFGFEWRMAPGEAEAELAYLNAAGIIDGVLTDDVDAFLFGAKTVWRNPSSTHAQTSATEKKNFVLIFQDVKLSRAELILIALCAGGDYSPKGLSGCSPKIAKGLARAGHADTLYRVATTQTREELLAYLPVWRAEVVTELRTNYSGCLGHRYVKLGNSVPETFPNVNILLAYTDPVTSPLEEYDDIDWMTKEPNIPAIAASCELYFEWGCTEFVVKRFRTLIWPGLALRILRRHMIEGDHGEDEKYFWRKFAGDEVVDVGEVGWMTTIHRTREHQSTGYALQYRVEVDVSVPVRLAEAGLQGWRRPISPSLDVTEPWQEAEDGTIDPAEDMRGPLLIWLPAVMVQKARPALVEQFEDMIRRRKEKKKPKGKKKLSEEMSGIDEPPPSPRKKKTVDPSATPHTPTKRKANPAFSNSTPSSSSRILLALDKFPKTKSPAASPTKTPSKKPAPFPMDLEREFGSPQKERDLRYDTDIDDKEDDDELPTPGCLLPPSSPLKTPSRKPLAFPTSKFGSSRKTRDVFYDSDKDDDRPIQGQLSPAPLPPITPSPVKAKARRQCSKDDIANKSPRKNKLDSPSRRQREKSPTRGKGKSKPIEVIVISSDDD